MSRRPPVDSACAGKVCYPADYARKRAQILRRAERDVVEAYRCPHCGWWHLGHVADWQRVNRRARRQAR